MKDAKGMREIRGRNQDGQLRSERATNMGLIESSTSAIK